MIRSRSGFLVELVLVLAGVLLAVLAVTRWVAVPWVVIGPSMEPTLRHGDRVIVDLWTYRRRAPLPGEIAVFMGPDGLPIVKRVVSGPLPATDPRTGPLLDPVRPDEPRFWVEGDASNSADSRLFGPVPQGRFLGRVLGRYWPLSRAGRIGSSPAAEPGGLRLPVR